MSALTRKPSTASSAHQAEIALLPHLKNCLLNLPASLVALLLDSNTFAQDVVVELSWRQAEPAAGESAGRPSGGKRSIFLGWTGMQSQSRLAPTVSRTSGVVGRASGIARQEQEVRVVEVDFTLGRMLGLTDGMKVGISLHIDPPQAHTVNIEPVTAADWEIIELHAHFLEMNFLSQVRALPNPTAGASHPLTLHLTPTSTANILVTSVAPAPPNDQLFVKISPDAEVIVAPKVQLARRASSARDNRSTASTGRRSESGRGTTSKVRPKSLYEDERVRAPLYLRAVSRALASEWFSDAGDDLLDHGLRLWVDPEHPVSKTFRGVSWVVVTMVKPAGLQEPVNPQDQRSADHVPASKVVARLYAWDDAPDSRHAALSSLLCAVLGVEDIVGGIVRIEPAPSPLPRTASALKEPSQQASKDAIIKRLRVTPFIPATAKKPIGFKFGGESKAERGEAAQRLASMFGKSLFDGPLTDGMLLPAQGSWPGGILDFEPTPPGDPSKARINWLRGSERKLDVSFQPEIARPKLAQPVGESLPIFPHILVAVDDVVSRIKMSLIHGSSVLLTGGLGSGKTSIAQHLAQRLRSEYLFHTTCFPCRTLATEETRVKPVKETLYRVFASASWGARLGGRAIVVLDDLDRICPVETELQVDANGKSRQVSELLCTLARELCGRDSNVVLLATAQSKEALNSVLVSSHIVRDITTIKAPSKDGRRQLLEMLTRETKASHSVEEVDLQETLSDPANAWMDGSDDNADGANSDKTHSNLDLLNIAGQTDGYMPGDLTLLVSRARSEALIRAASDSSLSDDVTLCPGDFAAALKGFTPASLRGVTLHSSTTTFASIGGLTQTRQILLETLQYPTTYAPLFAQCPLRLRSGLLLYGYPGCGKTLLASAVAGECGLNFISVKGPEILNKYIGASEKSVRDLFERAEAAKPCVLFFDEFDSIAPKRGHDSTGVTDRVVNMLLTMMDGAEGLSGVYVLAATSRPDLIDPALLRPGRLDKSLLCDMPNEADRLDILRAVCSKLRIDSILLDSADEQSLAEVARRTAGYSGADLQAVMYNAHLEAIHDVLGDSNRAAQEEFGKRNTAGAPRSGRSQDFTYFRLGDDTTRPNGTTSLSTLAAERAQIAASLSAMQLARRKAKQERQAGQQRPLSTLDPHVNGVEEHDAEPMIAWAHLQKGLEMTRSSISPQERRRLAAIYREFAMGRNGEMSDGQGGTEIGARASLM